MPSRRGTIFARHVLWAGPPGVVKAVAKGLDPSRAHGRPVSPNGGTVLAEESSRLPTLQTPADTH
jgi:hypothetical protein